MLSLCAARPVSDVWCHTFILRQMCGVTQLHPMCGVTQLHQMCGVTLLHHVAGRLWIIGLEPFPHKDILAANISDGPVSVGMVWLSNV